ncbi:hypothetical protein A2U01_0056638, partial [Trifolium medium]|nr:hypothetical protein [Trifolium medium]
MLDLKSKGDMSMDKLQNEVTTTNLMEEKLQNEATPFTDCLLPKPKCHNESVVAFERIVDATTETQRNEKERMMNESLPQMESPPPPEPPDTGLLVSQFHGDDSVSVMKMEEQGKTVEEKEIHHTIM